jgi:hypothetical protein
VHVRLQISSPLTTGRARRASPSSSPTSWARRSPACERCSSTSVLVSGRCAKSCPTRTQAGSLSRAAGALSGARRVARPAGRRAALLSLDSEMPPIYARRQFDPGGARCGS